MHAANRRKRMRERMHDTQIFLKRHRAHCCRDQHVAARWRNFDPGRIEAAMRRCLALHGAGRWQAVLNTKGSFSAPEEWAALLDRERHRIVGGEPATTVLVHAAHSNATRWPQIGDWKFERLSLPPVDGYLPLADGRYSMALAAFQT